MKEAKTRLDDEIFKLKGKVKLHMSRAERKTRLLQIQKAILIDLKKYIQKDIETLKAKQDKYGKWARFLASGGNSISVEELKQGSKQLQVLGNIEDRLSKKKERTLVDSKESQNAETMLRDQLISLEIVKPDEFDDLLDSHRNGNKELLDRIKNSPALRGKTRRAFKNVLIRAANNLKIKNSTKYKLDKLSKSDPNIGSLRDRVNYVTNNGFPGMRVEFKLLGLEIISRILKIENGVAILRDQSSRGYLVMDLNDNAITYRDNKSVIHDAVLTETMFSVSA